jgi:LysM repeat protein
MPSTKPEKARIINLDDSSQPPIECLFNPNEYTFSKKNTWTRTDVIGKNVPQLQFGGGDSMTLKMQLFFDTYTTGKDVRQITNRIWKLMSINDKLTDPKTGKGRPPEVEFQWGKIVSFKAVITEIKQVFTLFRYDGTPVRATLDVTFLQAKEGGKYPGQNPTTVGKPGYKRRVVKEGDSIDWIAYEEYGDSAKWRFIAETNNLDNPRRLKPGQVLAIAPKP